MVHEAVPVVKHRQHAASQRILEVVVVQSETDLPMCPLYSNAPFVTVAPAIKVNPVIVQNDVEEQGPT